MPQPTDQSLPQLGVVIPTKNSRPYLPAHLKGLGEWLDLAAEVVVVDSFSTDGTLEYLREHLKHPRVTYATHPPGLYASWNHGIAQVQAEFVFIATTGDLITREGVQKLLRAANDLKCDVVISKPAFRDLNDQPLPDNWWPIDDIIATLNLTAPQRLAKLEAVIFAVMQMKGAILGSSASNLYRTELMKRLPFPTEFGTTGDGAWGLQHAAEAVFGVVPGHFSSFLVHPAGGSDAEKKTYREAARADAVLKAAMELWRRNGAINDDEFARLHWPELMDELTSYLNAKSAFDRNRREGLPWILNPSAWKNRFARERATARLQKLRREILKLR
jgi:glycosyltransferase involved in cell wall biosynthesis